MPTKVVQLDIAKRIVFPDVEDQYQHYRILIKKDRQLLGWVHLPKKEIAQLSSQTFIQAIKKQLNNAITPGFFLQRFYDNKNMALTSESISVVICTRNRTAQLKKC